MSLPDLNPCKCPATEIKQTDLSTNFLNDPTYDTDGLANTVEDLSQHVKRNLPNTIELTPVPKQEQPTFIESIKQITSGLNWNYVIGGGLLLIWLTQDRRKNLG